MAFESRILGARGSLHAVGLAVLVTASSACAMAGFGGALQLNVTDLQTRQVTILVDAGISDARIIELDPTGEVELGTGSVTIDRYVLHRTGFGSSGSIGYFLCPKPCADPLVGYVVAYSPEQVFTPSGQLELHFRIDSTGGGQQEIRRVIRADMLPGLWQSPRIEARPGG